MITNMFKRVGSKAVMGAVALLLTATPAFADYFKTLNLTQAPPVKVENWVIGKCIDNKTHQETCGKGVVVQVLYGAEIELAEKMSKKLRDFLGTLPEHQKSSTRFRFIHAADVDSNKQTAAIVTYVDGKAVGFSDMTTKVGLLNEDYPGFKEASANALADIEDALSK